MNYFSPYYKTMKTTLDYYNRVDDFVKGADGKSRYCTDSIITRQQEVEATSEIELFEKFYKLNNRLRYCNGSYYEWQSKDFQKKYSNWLKSDDYKQKSFNLYYGNGVVD